MRIIFLLTFFFVGITKVDGQNGINCENGPYRLDNWWTQNKVNLEIKKNGNWHSFRFLDWSPGHLEAKCSLEELVDGKPKELIIRWSNESFGSGLVTKCKGLQIWRVDNPERIFKGITYRWMRELGGGKNNKGWTIELSQRISVHQGKIFVKPLRVNKAGPVEKNILDAKCKIDSLVPGTYKFTSNEKLFRISNYSLYVQNNEEFVLNFTSQTGDRLVIAKDTSNKYLVYRFGTESKIELEYPSQRKNSWENFKYSWKVRNEGIENKNKDLNYLYFKKGNYRYVVYQEYTARSKETKYGIKVINLKTQETTKIKAKPSTVEGSLGELRDNDKIKEGNKLFD